MLNVVNAYSINILKVIFINSFTGFTELGDLSPSKSYKCRGKFCEFILSLQKLSVQVNVNQRGNNFSLNFLYTWPEFLNGRLTFVLETVNMDTSK